MERLSKVEEYVPGLIIFITPNSMNILCCTYNEYYYVTSFPSLPSGLISWGGGWGGGGGGGHDTHIQLQLQLESLRLYREDCR